MRKAGVDPPIRTPPVVPSNSLPSPLRPRRQLRNHSNNWRSICTVAAMTVTPSGRERRTRTTDMTTVISLHGATRPLVLGMKCPGRRIIVEDQMIDDRDQIIFNDDSWTMFCHQPQLNRTRIPERASPTNEGIPGSNNIPSSDATVTNAVDRGNDILQRTGSIARIPIDRRRSTTSIIRRRGRSPIDPRHKIAYDTWGTFGSPRQFNLIYQVTRTTV